MTTKKLNVLFDGACHLCYREVHHYKKKDKKELLNTIDISDPNFNASDYGLSQADVNLHMHAFVEIGKPFIGVDCFIEIWRRIPTYQWLIPIFENRAFRPVINKGYDLFARQIRPRLPKRNCDDGQCAF